MLYNFEDMADLLGDELLTQEVTETAVSKAETMAICTCG